MTDRRLFLTSAAALSALSMSAVHAQTNRSDRLRLGLIGCGNRMRQLLKAIAKVREAQSADDARIEIVAISELFDRFERETSDAVAEITGTAPAPHHDYRELLARNDIDAVVIASPDHWHARQTIDALKAGKHVYCEKPMTHTVDEAFAVLDAWRASGRVMQVGVQTTSMPAWGRMRELLDEGQVGKVLQFQTEYFRNSNTGQTRFHPLTEDMTPTTIDWRRWLGVDEGLNPEAPFDRAVFRHWRCYWNYGGGMLTDLFVHRLTALLKATGLRYPGRVVSGGGIFLEYDDRETPDVATVTIDFPEGVQGLITATMCADATRIPQLIRGHFGSLVFDNGENFKTFEFVPERPQVTRDSKLKPQSYEVAATPDLVVAHIRNFFDAVRIGDPGRCNNPPELGAAAVVAIQLARRSYREGKVFCFDASTRTVSEGNAAWAAHWEAMSKAHAKPKHIPGWKAGSYGSEIYPPEYMKLAGPWIGGQPPRT
ncbi:MAG TPA: Gfo/Idh/MocA family oxidoreductase [Pirellulales bacterium]|nr:Gfo/Idh/MocA family oxidoreductase [Pirellulales bacterium]